MKLPRVLYVVGDFPRISETFIINEINELCRLGLSIEIFSLAAPRPFPKIMHSEALSLYDRTVYLAPNLLQLMPHLIVPPALVLQLWKLNLQYPLFSNQSSLKRWVRAIALAHHARQCRATHLHGHWTQPSDVAAMVARAMGLRFSFTVHAHDIYDEDPILEGKGGGIGPRSAGASFIATCTAYNQRYISQHYENRLHAPLYHVYHGVKTDVFMPSERINARPIILSVGRIIEYKGFDRLVDVLYQLHKDGKDFCAYIVGDGNLREALVQRVCLLGMTEKIIFTGSLSSEKVQEYYKRADIFVFAGSVQKGQYGLPNVLVEAMSAGLAVLTTALPTAVEIIESGKNGLVVIDDDEMLYEGLSTLVGDAELREHLGKEARKKALMQFSIEANTKTLYDLFVKSANEQAVK